MAAEAVVAYFNIRYYHNIFHYVLRIANPRPRTECGTF
jgi:hypothetical protein